MGEGCRPIFGGGDLRGYHMYGSGGGWTATLYKVYIIQLTNILS